MIRNSKTRLCSTLLATAAAIILTACTREPDAIPAPLPQDSLPAPAASAPGPAKAAADEPAPAARKPTAEMLSMMEMMRAIYADNAEYRDADLITDLPEPKKRSVVGSFLLQPVAMHELPDGQVAMIAAAQQVDSNGKSMAKHYSTGLLNVYLLRKEDGKWVAGRRFENIAMLGSFGQIGEVEWVMLAKDRPGFAMLHGASFQGFTSHNISLFDLTDENMRSLTEMIPIYSDNAGFCGPESMPCWEVTGKWRLETNEQGPLDDLVIDFSGYKEKRAAGKSSGTPGKNVPVASTARYTFRDGVYRLVSGKNIVPAEL